MVDEPRKPRTTPAAAILQPALARLLQPLVRTAIRAGLTFPALCDLLREVYVHVAEKDFALQGKEQTDSRISILTGIHRKEVRRLREAGAPISPVPGTVSRGSRIVAQWLAAPDFLDEAGRPRPLARNRAGATGPSFDDLVESVTRDIRPRAILDEWLEQGLVSIDAAQCVHLETSAFIPAEDAESLAYFFGRNVGDHLAAASENLHGRNPAFLERAVHYSGLTDAQARALESHARGLAIEALQASNRQAVFLTQPAAPAAPGTEPADWRWIFGVYLYREREAREAAHPQTAAPSSSTTETKDLPP